MDPDELAEQPAGARLLIVDDESLLREVLLVALRELGHRPVVCASAREALEVFRRDANAFDLVLTDFWMAEMNGVEFAVELRAIRPVPIVMLSAYCEGWTRERVQSVGICDLLHKPVAVEELDTAIRRAFEACQ